MKTTYYMTQDKLAVIKRVSPFETYYWGWEDKKWVQTYSHLFIEGDCNYDEATKEEAECAISHRTVPIYSI